MQANLLPLLNSNNCKALFTATTPSTKLIQKDFARFLSAYFLNLPLIYSNDPKRHLPCLFEWTQANEKDLLAKGYLLLPRENLAARLSPDFSPRSAILLLCKCELVLEAVLYSGYFNDFRTGLILRFYAEKVLGLNLIQHTFESVVENLFNLIEEFNGAEQKLQDVTASITAHIECIVQISVVFDIDILRNVEITVIQQIEYLFSSFESPVPSDILLPRPPVFSLPAQFAMQNNFELKIWNKIYFLIKLYIGLLQRTNRLHVILAKVLEHVNSAFIHSSDEDVVDIPTINESDNEVFEESLDNFYCLLLVVLRIFYRDNLSIAQNEEGDGTEIMEETYARLFPSSKLETDKQMFQNFLNHATESEFDSIFTFLHYLRENYCQKEVFLPPLSNDTLQQWQSVYSSSATLLRRDSSYETEPEWMFPEKLNLTAPDISKVKFLSNVMKTIFLNDPKLIQICLRIIPDDIFVADSFTVSQQLSLLNEEIFTPINTTLSPKIPTVEKAISSEESDIDLDQYEIEVKKEREFIRRLHISPVFYPPMSDNYRPKLAPPRLKSGDSKPINAKFIAATTLNDKLKQELESISTRLANLRPTTQTPINIQISQPPQSHRQNSQRSQGTFVSSSSIESSSSISKKLKHESKARMKRDRQKKTKIQQLSSSSLSSNKEEEEEVAVEQTDTSEAKRQRDYLQDMTLIPEPKLPKMEKLNLDQLSPPIQKKEDRTWQQIEIYSPSLEEAKANSSIEMSSINHDMVVNTNVPRPLPSSATQPLKPGYPEWLRLIPPKDDDSGRPNTSTSRLLDIELATKMAKKSNNSDSFKRYDSGFLDEVTTSQRSTKQTNRGISNKSPIAFAYSMTQEQINELENLCN